MTDEELIEKLARALNSALALEVERGVYAGETTHKERCAIARAILPIIEADRAELVAEIVTWLEEMYENCESIDGMLTRMDSKDELANMMQAKFGGRDGNE